MLTKNRRRTAGVAALALIPLLLSASANATEEEGSDGTIGVEKHEATCSPGDPITIETTYAGTSRVEITWRGCSCWDTAEEASAWLSELAERIMAGTMLGGEIERSEGEYTMVAELEPGEEVPLVAYCLTDDQIVGYLRELNPKERDFRPNRD